MSLVEIDTGSGDDLFAPPTFQQLTPGKHLFEVANDLVVEEVKKAESDNNVINLEAVCQDEDENKGRKVWDRVLIISDNTTEKGQIAQKINQAKLCQFTVACGVLTQDQIKSGSKIPLDEFKGKRFEAITKQGTYKDTSGAEKTKSEIVRYLFDTTE